MDGNGRWAERQGLARTDGHSQGEERLAEIVRAADALGIRLAHRLRVLHRELAPPPARGRLHPRVAQEDLRSPRGDARQQREDPLDRTRHPRRLAHPRHRAPRDREVDPPHRAEHRTQLHRRVRLRRSAGAGRGRARHRGRAARPDRRAHRRPPPLRARASARRPHDPHLGRRRASPTSSCGRASARSST